jgi:hypothetical protein
LPKNFPKLLGDHNVAPTKIGGTRSAILASSTERSVEKVDRLKRLVAKETIAF